MASFYKVMVQEGENEEAYEANLFDLDTDSLMSVPGVRIWDEPNKDFTAQEAIQFTDDVISDFAHVASQKLFDEFMEDTNVLELLNEGSVAYWTDAEEFAESELLELMNVDFDDQIGRILYRNINFESLAQDIVDTADSGDEFLYDDGVWVRRAVY